MEATPHIADVPTYLKNLNQSQPNHPLLSTENWLALQVKQQETGYRTFWDYLSPSEINPNSIDSEKINEAIFNFFKDWAEANLDTMGTEAISQALSEVARGFEEWIDTNISSVTESTITPILEEMFKTFEKWAGASETQDSHQEYPTTQIFETVRKFFTEDDWHFTKIKGEPILRLAFQGKNGKFDCYAKTRVERVQFLFYSVCPFKVPKPKRRAVGEFIARANYGTIIGNFELDFVDGEIRYKTSVDVENYTLTFDQIKHLVYTNVMMMDEYLPGIISVINGDESPEVAISLIEKIDLSSPLSDSPPSNNLTDNQRLSQKILTESDIFSQLTRLEISQFAEVIELQRNLRKNQAQTKLEQLKTGLKNRLGEVGKEIFEKTAI